MEGEANKDSFIYRSYYKLASYRYRKLNSDEMEGIKSRELVKLYTKSFDNVQHSNTVLAISNSISSAVGGFAASTTGFASLGYLLDWCDTANVGATLGVNFSELLCTVGQSLLTVGICGCLGYAAVSLYQKGKAQEALYKNYAMCKLLEKKTGKVVPGKNRYKVANKSKLRQARFNKVFDNVYKKFAEVDASELKKMKDEYLNDNILEANKNSKLADENAKKAIVSTSLVLGYICGRNIFSEGFENSSFGNLGELNTVGAHVLAYASIVGVTDLLCPAELFFDCRAKSNKINIDVFNDLLEEKKEQEIVADSSNSPSGNLHVMNGLSNE